MDRDKPLNWFLSSRPCDRMDINQRLTMAQQTQTIDSVTHIISFAVGLYTFAKPIVSYHFRHWQESRSREILEEKWLRFSNLAREKLIFMSRSPPDFQESEEKFLCLLSIFKIFLMNILIIDHWALYVTLFDHFHFHPTAWLVPDLILTLCQTKVAERESFYHSDFMLCASTPLQF
jgi:hypothetical protein